MLGTAVGAVVAATLAIAVVPGVSAALGVLLLMVAISVRLSDPARYWLSVSFLRRR